MSSNIAKALVLASTLGLSTGVLAAGEAGDIRVQLNGTTTDAYTFLTGSIQRYQSETLVIGGSLTLSDFSTILGGKAKMIFPTDKVAVPYVSGSGSMFLPDVGDDEFVLAISGGVDLYIAENAGYNFDLEVGLSDANDDTTFSFGMFYEF